MPSMPAQHIATDKMRLVVGLGRTGWSVVRYLKRHGHPFAVADTRSDPPHGQDLAQGMPDIALSVGKVPLDWVERCDEMIISPGLDPRLDFVRHARALGKAVVGDLELFRQAVTQPIIAVSGSNAKSTVVALLGHIAKNLGLDAPSGGNLGVPALDLLNQQAACYILEVSSFQLETGTELGADPACLLNVTPDHLDRYTSFEDYYRTKHRIFKGCRSAVFNRDDKLTRPLFAPQGRTLRFGSGAPDIHDLGLLTKGDQLYLAKGSRFLLPTSALRLRGRHNYSNVLAALAVAELAGWSQDDPTAVLRAVQTFRGLEHRCEWIGRHRGVDYINDSKATNPQATCAALNGLAEDYQCVHVILGGSSKHADFKQLAQVLDRIQCKVYLIGEEGERIDHDLTPSTTRTLWANHDLSAALRGAAKAARPGDLVLLSPACASYDAYRDYAHRGAHFRQLVTTMGKQ